MIADFFLRLASRFVPEPFQRFAAWALGIMAALAALAALSGLVWAIWAIWLQGHDADVVDRHEQAVEAAAAGDREISAEERSIAALENQMRSAERDRAIAPAVASEAAKLPAERATQAPQIKALNCALMREDYTPAELAKIKAYRESCS